MRHFIQTNGAEQSVGDARDGGIHPAREAGEHEPPHLLRLTADGNDLHAVRNRAEDDRCDGGDREPGGDDLQLGEPVAHDVANVRPLTKPGHTPSSESPASDRLATHT